MVAARRAISQVVRAHRHLRVGSWPLLLAAVLLPGVAWAQSEAGMPPEPGSEPVVAGPDVAAPSAAATPSTEEPGAAGVAAYNAADFARALELLDADYQRAPLPTVGLWSARTLAKLGRLLEAEKRYAEVAQIEDAAVRPAFAAFRPEPPTAVELDAEKEAIEDAAEEGRALALRIPAVRIRVERPPAGELSVSLNGEALPLAELEMPRRLDPGNYRVEARVGDMSLVRALVLTEAEQPLVVLTFPPERLLNAQDDDPGAAQRTVGWVGVGVGIGGIALGAVLAGIAGGQLADLDCPDDVCSADQTDEVDAYNNLRVASGVSMIVGGLLTATGIALIGTAPHGSESSAWLTPAVGPAGIGLRGTF